MVKRSTRVYLGIASLLGLSAFISPAIGYVRFIIGVHIPYLQILSACLFLVFLWRLFLLGSGGLPFFTPLILYSWILLGALSFRQLLGFWEAYPLDAVGYIQTLALTLIYPWIYLLGGEALALIYDRSHAYVQTGYLLLLATTTIGAYEGFMATGNIYVLFSNYRTGMQFNYQTLGDSLGLLAVLSANSSGRISSMRLLVNALFISFTYSRSSLLAYLIAALAEINYKLNIKRYYTWGISLVYLALILSVTSYVLLTSSRHSLFDTAISRSKSIISMDDPSIKERLKIFESFPKMTSRYGLLGRFMYELSEQGRGYYVHNILSYWLEYGVFPFIILLIILFLVVVRQFTVFKTGNHTGLAVIIFVAVSVLLSRPYVWPYLWFGLGFASVFPHMKKSGLIRK